MDITTGNTAGRDGLRDFLRAGALIPDAELQAAWDAAVDATSRYIRPAAVHDAPAGVVQFVYNVAAHIWRTRDTAGETQILPDGTVTSQLSLQTVILKYRHTAGPWVVTPRVVA